MIPYRMDANRGGPRWWDGRHVRPTVPRLVTFFMLVIASPFIWGFSHLSVASPDSSNPQKSPDAPVAQGNSLGIGIEPEKHSPVRQGLPKRLVRWLGKFHVVIVHFPIALLMAAALGEVWMMWRKVSVPQPAVRFCVLLGAAGAVSAAGLGWLHALGGAGADLPQILFLHRWLGTVAGAWALATALLSEVDVHSGRRTWRFRVMLFLGALLVGLVGHLGGTLVYGEDYFNWSS